MQYAVIKSGGKQYKVSVGDLVEVERLTSKPNSKFEFEEVLLIVDDNKTTIGNPFVKNIKVWGTVVENFRGPKIRVTKYKAKVRFRRVNGHRQELTKVKIEGIGTQVKPTGSKNIKTTKKISEAK